MSKSDPIEELIRSALDELEIPYRRDDPLDFECGGFAIECKQFSTPRTAEQIKDRTDIILIQGREGALGFIGLLSWAANRALRG